MLYGLNTQNQRITATRGVLAACPLCKSRLIAKCGQFVCHHWAHKSTIDCDPWHSEETNWHYAWKELFPEESREVVLGNHRADVKLNDLVLEFQYSPLSRDKVQERQEFYHSHGLKVFWIFEARDYSAFWWAEESDDHQEFYARLNHARLMWSFPDYGRSILHFGNDDMLWLHQSDGNCSTGFFIQRPILIKRLLNHQLNPPTSNLYKIHGTKRDSLVRNKCEVRNKC